MPKRERTGLENEISRAEKEILNKKKELAELRRRVPRVEIEDYSLKDFDGKSVKLSALFGNRDELIIVHNMGKSCRYCTLWADGFNGIVGHLENRAPFVVVSPDDPATQRDFAESRGWKFRMLSAQGATFLQDMGFEGEDGDPWPGVSTYHRGKDGKLFRVARTYFGPGDDFCSAWHLFDLLSEGVNAWEPKYKYE